jgi:hypothetical protein
MLIILFGIISVIVIVCLFSNSGQLLMTPLISPEKFLSSMPHISISLFGNEKVLIQPSSTFFVYFLGFFMILIGVYFFITRNGKKSRKYWGIGIILWGISAIVAGTSYQAFGYELKCAGRDYCLYTSNFELVYMLLTAYCINFLVASTGYTSVGQVGQKRLLRFALIDSIVYSIYLVIGAVVPIKFLISYEGFMAFIGGNFILMFILNIRHYKIFKDILNRNLIIIWLGFLIVNLGYFAFLFGGFGQKLYLNHGIWFNENDILHILLILWSAMTLLLLRSKMDDKVEDQAS